MFVVPICQPANELYGSVEMKLHKSGESPETTGTLEQRLQLLGIKNSVVQEKLDGKTQQGTAFS